jgi:hypothetical protein
MTHFIELTTPQGQKFLANVSHIERLVELRRLNSNENTLIYGLTEPAGIYVREMYVDIQKALYDKLRLHNPIIKL